MFNKNPLSREWKFNDLIVMNQYSDFDPVCHGSLLSSYLSIGKTDTSLVLLLVRQVRFLLKVFGVSWRGYCHG